MTNDSDAPPVSREMRSGHARASYSEGERGWSLEWRQPP